MKNLKASIKAKGAPTGPKPKILKVRGNWQSAIKKSLAKKKPLSGWPK